MTDVCVSLGSQVVRTKTRAVVGQESRVFCRLVLIFSFAMICATTAWAQTTTPPNTLTVKRFVTSQEREDAIRKASVYTAKSVADADIMAGPKQKKKEFQFHLNDKVTCDFVSPGQEMGGNTPKFLCKITKVESLDGTVQTLTPEMDDSDPLKMKFGASNKEVYARSSRAGCSGR